MENQMIAEENIKLAVDVSIGEHYFQPDEDKGNFENFVYILRHIDTILKLEKALSKAGAVIEEAEGLIEEHSRWYDHKKMLCVNVKRYGDYVDVEKLIEKLEITENEKKHLMEKFDESYINSLWDDFIYFSQSYIIDDFLKGCTLCGKKYWEEQIERIKSGDKTDYPAIDELKTNEEKIHKLKECMKEDIKQKEYLDALYTEEAGFYGRSGGWFSIESSEHLTNTIDEISALIEEYKDIENFHEIGENEISYLKELAKDLRHHIEAIDWILGWVKDYNERLSFEDEVQYRIEEALDDYRADKEKKKCQLKLNMNLSEV